MTFAIPSRTQADAEEALLARGELFNGLGQRVIITPDTAGSDKPKLRGYTRVTSFIKALEDTTALEKWRTRLVLEGAPDVGLEERVLLALQQRIQDEAEDEVQAAKTYRETLDDIADHAFLVAGGKDAADYGTALHHLVEDWFAGKLSATRAREVEREWPGITQDFVGFTSAYENLVNATGAELVHSEVLVVDDKLKTAGRTDFVLRMKLPGDQRARRIIMDIKTGKIDRPLSFCQQLAIYAGSKLYDPETGERSPLRVRQDKAIIAHVPRGEAKTHFHLVDLAAGRRANSLVLRVRESRRKQPGIIEAINLEELS